jgi:mono/diheme cytochrome c family protein
MTVSRFLCAAFVVGLAHGSPAGAQEARKVLDGKQVFLDQKCNMCHGVSAAGITATSKIKAADLTDVAAKLDAAWLGKYLRKQADSKGKQHTKAFTGSDEELGAMIAWLQKQVKAKK